MFAFRYFHCESDRKECFQISENPLKRVLAFERFPEAASRRKHYAFLVIDAIKKYFLTSSRSLWYRRSCERGRFEYFVVFSFEESKEKNIKM